MFAYTTWIRTRTTHSYVTYLRSGQKAGVAGEEDE